MRQMEEFPFPIEAPDSDDPFYEHPAFPYAMVITDNKTGVRYYAVIIHFDGEGRVRLWVCKARKVIVMLTDTPPLKGAPIKPIDIDATFICPDCGGANDLWATKKRCGACVSGGN